MTQRKYEFTGKTRKYLGNVLRRIRRISDGALGGWIQREDNLSHKGNCWIGEEAKVLGCACVVDNAYVSGEALVHGNARVCHTAHVTGFAHIHQNAYIYGSAHVCDDANVSGYACVGGDSRVLGFAQVYGYASLKGCAYVYDDAHVFGNAGVSGHGKVYGCAHVMYGMQIIKDMECSVTPFFADYIGHPITICDNKIGIGCLALTLEEWGEGKLRCEDDLGCEHEYTEEEIDLYRLIVIPAWNAHQKTLRRMKT